MLARSSKLFSKHLKKRKTSSLITCLCRPFRSSDTNLNFIFKYSFKVGPLTYYNKHVYNIIHEINQLNWLIKSWGIKMNFTQ